MLIAHVYPILQVTHARGGQYKYKGHIIRFPQNIENITKKLLHSIKDLPIIIVRIKDQHGTRYHFIVNRDHVYKTLEYKIMHGKFYFDVTIDANALDELSINSHENIFDLLRTMHMKFHSYRNEIVFVRLVMEADESNIYDHTTSMASSTKRNGVNPCMG